MKTATATSEDKLERYNRWLSLANILVALYIIIAPLLPGLFFYLRKHFSDPSVYSGRLADEQSDEKPKDNRLVIPSILLDEVVHEGPTEATLNKGVWRRPHTAVPSQDSNTVMSGHVFTYTSPAVFYNLGKVNVGDELAVYWEGSEYLYRVTEKKTVPASAIEIEAPTEEARLTLYTCTPLWNPVNRLVVVSDLVEVTEL